MKVTLFDPVRRYARVELSRRNLEILLAKLDDETSRKTITKSDEEGMIEVRAVENSEHYEDRAPGAMLVKGEIV